MRNVFARFGAIIIALAMVATLLPVTAFAEDAVTETVSATFVVDGKTYYLMPESSVTYNGKTYIGVYANVQELDYKDSGFAANANTQERIVLIPDGNRMAGGKYVVVNRSYTNPVDIQTKVTHFAPLGSYIIDSDYEWPMGSMYYKKTDGSTTAFYLKGSVGLPTTSELKKLYANDAAVKNSNGLATRTTSNIGVSGGAFWQSVTGDTSNNTDYVRIYVEDDETKDVEKFVSRLGAAWGYMTYVELDFFKNTKIDVDSMGSVVKNYLAANYIQDDFAGLGYTTEDLAAMGIPVMPANPTPAYSPNYVKTADGTLELLYNDTKVVNGETYVGFTVAKDYQVDADTRGALFATTETLSDGTTNPNTSLYGQYKFCTAYPITNKESFDTIKDSLPQDIQQNLYLNTWENVGSTYWLGVRGGEGAAKSISYITLPSGEEMIKHGAYLKTQMDDNPNPYYGGLVTYTGALVRDVATYSAKLYDPADGTVKASGASSPQNYGSIFPTFYVSVDFMKSLKLDVETMRSNVKALFPASFVRGDLEGLYTDDELDELGVESFRVEEKPEAITGSSFVAGDKTFYYLNDTIDYNGKKYFRIFDKRDATPWNGDAYYPITERAEGGIYVELKQGSLTGSDLQNHSTNLGVFDGYKISSDYEWDYGTAMYNGASTPVYLKGSINVPTTSDYNYVIDQGISFTSQGQMRITSTFFVWANGTNRHNFSGNQQGNGALTYVEDGNYYKGVYSAGYNYVTYVSEDYFVENELDLATTGEVMINAIKANFTREELSAGGWSESVLDKLFNSSYTGSGLGLVVYKTGDASVDVVINNNNSVSSTGSKVIVVAAYSEDGLEASGLVNVTGTIPANSYTSKLPATLDVADDVEITEIKVMLWDSIDNMKPLANIVTLK